MKAVKSEELRALSDEELARREKDHRESLFKIRMKLATGQMSRMADIIATKRNLARILTEQNRRHKAAQ
jgi:ribosomal protein L29